MVIIAFAGIGARPAATTLFNLSTPTIGPPPIGQVVPIAAIWASVKRFEMQGPGRPTKKARLETKLGDP